MAHVAGYVRAQFVLKHSVRALTGIRLVEMLFMRLFPFVLLEVSFPRSTEER